MSEIAKLRKQQRQRTFGHKVADNHDYIVRMKGIPPGTTTHQITTYFKGTVLQPAAQVYAYGRLNTDMGIFRINA